MLTLLNWPSRNHNLRKEKNTNSILTTIINLDAISITVELYFSTGGVYIGIKQSGQGLQYAVSFPTLL